jgi:hypothetical protein
MNYLKYILLTFVAVFLIAFLYNSIMSEKCLEQCDRDESCWEENHCRIGI